MNERRRVIQRSATRFSAALLCSGGKAGDSYVAVDEHVGRVAVWPCELWPHSAWEISVCSAASAFPGECPCYGRGGGGLTVEGGMRRSGCWRIFSQSAAAARHVAANPSGRATSGAYRNFLGAAGRWARLMPPKTVSDLGPQSQALSGG